MKPVILSIDGAVATISLNRPPLNILNRATIALLDRAVRVAARDRRVAVILITSAVERTFSGGVDIKEHYPRKARSLLTAFHRLIRRLITIDKVTMAVVDGHCLGGGCELAICCDMVLASARSRFGFPEITVGCFPPVAAVHLASLVGWRKAAELILTGDPMTAEEARSIGLITLSAPQEILPRATQQWLDRVLTHSPVVLQKTAKALRAARREFGGQLRLAERIYLNELIKTRDAREGLDAYLEKRPPRWKGR